MGPQDVALYVHLVSLGVSVCGIGLADHAALQWLRGKQQTLTPEVLGLIHRAVGIGLGMMLGSGFVLFTYSKEYLLANPVFYLKMGFVLTLLVNSFFIERHLPIASQQAFKTLTRAQKIPLFISGALSTLCWVGAGISAWYLL